MQYCIFIEMAYKVTLGITICYYDAQNIKITDLEIMGYSIKALIGSNFKPLVNGIYYAEDRELKDA